jgi:uncharacterized SAM-binding protein YcdF (DUF218 family)
MFMFKKILSPFFYPVPLSLGILGLGLFLLWFTRRRQAGRLAVALGVGLLAFCSFSFGSGLLLGPLEHRYPPLLRPPGGSPIKWVVVLGGGVHSAPDLPITGRISDASLFRVVEGVRWYKQLPGSKLVLSGGGPFETSSGAEVMAEIARIQGVDSQDLVLEAASLDTEEQARLIKDLVGRDPCILVTSAVHMPRSMALFEKQGLEPIPAPTGFFLHQGLSSDPGRFFPSAQNLQGSEVAVHEYLGLAWAWFRGAI